MQRKERTREHGSFHHPFSTSAFFHRQPFSPPRPVPVSPHKSRLRDVVAASCGRPVREEGFGSASGRARSWLEWDRVWDGTVLGYLRRWIRGPTVSARRPKTRWTGCHRGGSTFLSPFLPFLSRHRPTVSFISTLLDRSGGITRALTHVYLNIELASVPLS